MRFPIRSLRARLLSLLTLTTLPIAALAIYQAVAEYDSDRADIQASLQSVAAVAASEVKEIVSGAQQVLSVLASQPTIVTMAQPACDRALQNFFLARRDFENIAAFDLEGKARCSKEDIPENASVAGRAWFRAVLAGEDFVVSELVPSDITGRRVIVFAAPLRDDSGQLVGVLDITIGSTWLAWLSRVPGPADLSFSALVDRNGLPLEAQQIGAETLAKFPSAAQTASALREQSYVFFADGRDGDERAYAVTPVVAGQLYLLVAREESELFGRVRFDLVAGLLYPLLIWLGVMVCIWIGIDRLVLRWLRNLGRLAAHYGAGNLEARPQKIAEAPDEFAQLGRAMMEMAGRIEKRTEDLEQAIDEKNWLIREVHHRVKNNMQIVSSLLNLQMRRLSDPKARAAFADAQARLGAFELVHRALYQAENLNAVHLRSFLSDLVGQLVKTHPARRDNVQLELDLSDIVVSPDKAVPLGLLVTEVVSNSLKHGFPPPRSGTIKIGLSATDDGDGLLLIQDDGVGKSEDHLGFGSQLIATFAQQLHGELEVSLEGGMTTRLSIPQLRPPEGAAA